MLVSAYCVCRTEHRTHIVRLAPRWLQFACLAFLGIFCLYFFETKAFSLASIPLVSFLTYAAGGATVVLAGRYLGERLTRR
ncbi:DMT family transporter, partial [Pandoraea pneumonica]